VGLEDGVVPEVLRGHDRIRAQRGLRVDGETTRVQKPVGEGGRSGGDEDLHVQAAARRWRIDALEEREARREARIGSAVWLPADGDQRRERIPGERVLDSGDEGHVAAVERHVEVDGLSR